MPSSPPDSSPPIPGAPASTGGDCAPDLAAQVPDATPISPATIAIPETGAIEPPTPSASGKLISDQTAPTPASTQSTCGAQPSQRPRKRRRYHYTLVEPGSLYDVMHENAGVSLFIRPIAWTDKHNAALKLEPAAYVLCKELSAIFSNDVAMPFYSVSSIREVLSQLYPRSGFAACRGEACPEMRVWFGSRVHRDAIRVQCMWRWPYPTYLEETQSGNRTWVLNPSRPNLRNQPRRKASPAGAIDVPARCGKPMLAYIGRKQLTNIRANIYRVALGPGRTPNEPVARLQALRSKLLIPANADYDPHLVAVLLAMAQEHLYPHNVAPPRAGHGRAAYNANADFVVYTATFSADYLRQFHYPHQAFPQTAAAETEVPGAGGQPGLDIEVVKVPIWPIIGLRERLGQALSEEVVGYFDVEQPETWDCTSSESEEAETESEPTLEAKRRRGPPTIFSGSFEEEFSEPRRNGKRRRLAGEGSNQVEVVM
ncbi:unnamed protein product [Parascedosporium putredinis]|uniref:Uncharacterized protein n=1 Tax=Parascedosporium putredinis TaxID=1442378 RepID=A0A9P1H8W1_9PEZI|nr:unnamed protein product [Parascedosporium putredinis]CAI7999786.1 unnamed protein product [Parascedosporium putredinis]